MGKTRRAATRGIGAAVIAAAGLPGLAAAQDIPVGHLADLTGATASIGVDYANGIADTLDWVNANGGVDGRQIDFETVDYAYQAPRAVSTYRRWTSGDGVVAIQGWGTADTEALIDFVRRDEIPYYSASYSGVLTDPTGEAPNSTKAAPFNFFYGPSYSDACRALAEWSWQDWQDSGEEGTPVWVHMGDNHPYPNSPKQACTEYAEELGFEVADPITYSLAPGDFTPQCLTLNEVEADYAYVANIAGSTISLLNSCATAETDVQFVSNVWGYDENVMKAAGQNADGVVVAVRTGSIWTDDNAGLDTVREISAQSDESGGQYRVLSYLSGVCSAMYMVEAMEIAAESGDIAGPAIRDAMYAREDWVPEGLEDVCLPSTWTPEDHRGLMTVPIYRGRVTGSTEGRTVTELMGDGTMALEKVGQVDLPRRPEWLGY
ncbi:MAG: ABC transporter substrate-binding protein [Azospirillaceae bacterium]